MSAVRTSVATVAILITLAACDSGAPAAPNGMTMLPVGPPPSGTPANPAAAAGGVAGKPASAPTPAAGTGTTSGPIAGASAGAGQSPAGAGAAAPMLAAGSGSPMQPAAGSGVAGSGVAGGGAVDPGDADIETCYELRAHGKPMPGDTSTYSVPGGETYTGFIMKAPWTKPVQGLRFRHLADNAAVVHHWLLYSETAPLSDGEIEACSLDAPTGFLCGQATTRALITGWAPGRGDFRLPAGVGLELPPPGSLLAVEVHYFNTGAQAVDRSGVEVCVTSKFRPNTASITWLGTQQINVAPGMTGTASGTCRPLRTGMNSTDPINVIFSWPHMHKTGKHLKSVVTRAAGGQEVMYDGEFSFDRQVLHESPMKLMPGDSVTTTCTFQNTTAAAIGFGQSTQQEMCYNFTYAWPAHALDNPGAEIGGATNACLH